MGLAVVFVMSVLAATILPVGSEPVLVLYLTSAPDMFWVAIGLATLGNTLGGVVSYGMGAGAHGLFGRWRNRKLQAQNQQTQPGSSILKKEDPAPSPARLSPARARAERLVHRFGAPVLLLAWLPVIGDPLCLVAGWLRLPFWQCVIYMAIGKFGRYLTVAGALMWAIDPT